MLTEEPFSQVAGQSRVIADYFILTNNTNNTHFSIGFFACNHHRAPLYFAESINTETGFWGWPCPSYFVSIFGRCPPTEPQIIMGEHVNSTAKGVHLVITDSVSPFAVGKYTGPLVEIYYTRSGAQPTVDYLEQNKKEVSEFYDLDDLPEGMTYSDIPLSIPNTTPLTSCSNLSKDYLDLNCFTDYFNLI